MRTKIRKPISILLSLVMLLSVFGGLTFTASAENANTATFSQTDNGNYVTWYMPNSGNGDYTAEFKLDGVPMERTNTKTFILSEDKELDVVNIKNGIIPTGVNVTAAGIAGVAMISLCTAAAVILLRKRRFNAE